MKLLLCFSCFLAISLPGSCQVVSRDWIAMTSAKQKNGLASVQSIPVVRVGTSVGTFVSIAVDSIGADIVSVSDTRGNVYIIDSHSNVGAGTGFVLASSVSTLPLQVGDQFLIQFSGNPTAFAMIALAFDGLSQGVLQEMSTGSGFGLTLSSGIANSTSSLRIGTYGANNSYSANSFTQSSDYGLTITWRIGTSGGKQNNNVWVALGYRSFDPLGPFSVGGTMQVAAPWSAVAASYQ